MTLPTTASLPPPVPYPPKRLRTKISHDDWNACLDAWILFCRAHLSLFLGPLQKKIDEGATILPFVISYCRESAQDHELRERLLHVKARELHSIVFAILDTALSDPSKLPTDLLHWQLICDISRIYCNLDATRRLLERTWDNHMHIMQESLQRPKDILIELLDQTSKGSKQRMPVPDDRLLYGLCHLVNMLPPVGELLMTGSDLIDAMASAYPSIEPNTSSHVLVLVFSGLVSLLHLSKPNISLLVDQLYNLQASARPQKSPEVDSESLVVALVSDTSLISRISKDLPNSEIPRARKILSSLDKLRRPPKPRSRKHIRRKTTKGKSKVSDEYGHGAFDHLISSHRMSLVTTIQDVFPDLGSAFILRLLDLYEDDQETILAHLLENDLPADMRDLDRTENLPPTLSTGEDALRPDDNLAPHSRSTEEEILERRNIYDNDDFDRRAIASSQVRIGRKDQDVTADDLLAGRMGNDISHNAQKAAILSALASFDPDDDERDDTYDVADVGGTVDSARPGDDAELDDMRGRNEEALFRAYQASPQVFERDGATRRGSARKALRSETGMTDEAIEGWALMARRVPGRMNALEGKFASFSGQQRELTSTKWRNEEAAESEGSGAESVRGSSAFRGRGRGTGRASVAGLADDKRTQIARGRKEANKSSRANHNRRDQRAKKMTRAGFPG